MLSTMRSDCQRRAAITRLGHFLTLILGLIARHGLVLHSMASCSFGLIPAWKRGFWPQLGAESTDLQQSTNGVFVITSAARLMRRG
jgi:hypothetical protein